MAEAASEEVQQGKSSGGLLQIINLVLLLLVLGVGGFIAWKLMQMEQQAAAPAEQPAKVEEAQIPEAEDEAEGPPILMDINDITVNLADTDQSRFLRAKAKIEVRSEEAKAKVTENMVKINDLIITVLSSKKFSDIRTPNGKYALKEDLVYRMNRLIGGKPIKNLYFTDFVSQ